jgi:serine/threonine protein kinase
MREWTEALPEEEDPSGEETSVNEEDEQAMTRGGVEPMYSGSAPKCQWTETLAEEEDPSGEETSDDEEKEATISGEGPSSEEDEEATTSGGVKPIYSGTAPNSYWTQTLPAKEEDASGVEETSVNEEDVQAMTRGGGEPMYSDSAPKCQWTETLAEEEDPSGEETSDDEDKEATTSGEDPSSEVDEEATTSRGVKPIYSGTAPKSYWTQTLPAKEENPSGVETSVNEEDEKPCFRLVRRIYPSELKIVRKIAQGGQAKIFLAKYLKTQQDVVVKRYTSCQVQAGELQRQMERVMKACEKRYESGLCRVIGVSVDERGRVSTVMELMGGDLRTFIDCSDSLLSYGDRLGLMKAIARGIKELHGCGFIHKDLKASNILVCPIPNRKLGFFDDEEQHLTGWKIKPIDLTASNKFVPLLSLDMRVAYAKRMSFWRKTDNYWKNMKSCDWSRIDVKIGDYESSDVVFGTGFFRAPEVLRALRDGTKVEYSPAVDVYGFGMVCYELLTGKLPFHGHPMSDYDLVLSGQRPDVSNELPWMRKLLHRCWHEDPHQRPGWDEILQILM